MSENKQVNRREQVKECINAGTFTKAEIAEHLGVNTASVSSQMTYLRWMGNFIVADENKKLRFVSEEEHTALTEVANANKKAKTVGTAKTPQEQANALAKALKNQKTLLAKAQAKVDQVNKDVAVDPSDTDLLELQAEAMANLTLLTIKIKRNGARATGLPTPEVVETMVTTDEVDSDGPDGPDTDDDLI